MTGVTTNEGYPYPLETDFADVQDAFRLATAIDSDLRAQQTPIRNFLSRPSFIGMQASTQAGVTIGSQYLQMGTVEWDNTGGISQSNNTVWAQPTSQGPSWWLFGTTLRVNPTGAQVVGDENAVQIAVQSANQVTGVSSITYYSDRRDDTNTNGEWLNMFTIAPIYRGLAASIATFSGSTAKGILAGSRFWGIYLGPVD